MMVPETPAIRSDDPAVTAHVRQVLDQASTELDEDLLLGDEIRAWVDVKPIGHPEFSSRRAERADRDQPASPRHYWSRGAPGRGEPILKPG